MDRRTFLKTAAIGSIATGLGAYLPGCISAKSTWVCSDGVCIGKGITITKINDQETKVVMDASADRSGYDENYFKSPLLTWSPALSVGVEQMDQQHVRWIYIINSLNDAMKTGNPDKVLLMILNGVLSFAKTHFSDEETLLSAYDFPGLAGQQFEHEYFVRQVNEYKKRFESGHALISLELMNLLKTWVQNHIMIQDKQYGVFLNAKGVY
ncbi:MAG: bacteriohemerythrin [Deltaproteobacteria bacterium]